MPKFPHLINTDAGDNGDGDGGDGGDDFDSGDLEQDNLFSTLLESVTRSENNYYQRDSQEKSPQILLNVFCAQGSIFKENEDSPKLGLKAYVLFQQHIGGKVMEFGLKAVHCGTVTRNRWGKRQEGEGGFSRFVYKCMLGLVPASGGKNVLFLLVQEGFFLLGSFMMAVK